MPLISINLCAEGYSTNMPVEADPEEIFEDLQIKAVAGISEYELKEKSNYRKCCWIFQNDRIYYISAEYNQLQKKTEKDSKNKEFNFREKQKFSKCSTFYQPSDENYLIGYEYKGIEKLKIYTHW